MEQLNNFLDGMSSNISSDEDEPSVSETISPPPFPNLSKQQKHKVMKSAKCIAELCEQIQSLGHYHLIMFYQISTWSVLMFHQMVTVSSWLLHMQ